MAIIDRQVHIDAAPAAVAARLAASTWRGAFTIHPQGAGTRVDVHARIEPETLAVAVESAALQEVCHLRQAFAAGQSQRMPTTDHERIDVPARNRRTTMTAIKRTVSIDAPAEKVWPALADFGGISAWNPNVKASRLTSARTEGADITRECRLAPMGTVQERVTEWIEGRMMTIEITEFKNVPAMRSAVAVIELEPAGDRSMVSMQIDYEVGLGALGAGMNSMMMKRQYAKAISGLLAGLKHHVETGQTIGGNGDVPRAALAAVSA